MSKRIFNAMIIAICSSLLLTACATNSEPAKVVNLQDSREELIEAADPGKSPEAAKNRKDTFIAGIRSPGGVFLPYFYENGWDGNATEPIFAPLVRLDKEGKPTPILAEKWEISPDQLRYTFHLRQGLKFSDGSPLTADDVAFTLTLLHDPAYNGDTDISLAAIKGGQAYTKGNRDSIEGIKVIDSHTIEITTERVNAQALLLLGGPVLSKAYYGKSYQKGNLEYLKAIYPVPLGAGPYKFEKYIPGQEIHYVANEYYYAGKPPVEHFIFKITANDTNFQLFQMGENDYDGFDANSDNIEQLRSLGFANIRISTVNDYGFVYVNNARPFLKDKAVRQALIYGLDRQKYVAAKCKGYGQVATVPVSPLSWSYTEEGITRYEYNLEKAKELLDEAGWKVGADGIREKNGQKLQISYLTRRKDDELIPIAKENYTALGIEFNPEIMDFNAITSKLKQGNYDLAAVRTDVLLDPNDGVNEFLSSFQGNYARYSNPQVDKLIVEGISTTDIEKRKSIYKELYKAFMEDPPIILLDYRKSAQAYNSRIQGLEIDSYNGISASLSKVSIQP